MSRFLRLSTIALLPIFTLLLGWQLGARYEQTILQEAQERLDMLYSGESGSGRLVTDPQKEVDISLLWSVWRLLIKHYIAPEDLEVTPLVFGAIEGMVRAVDDPYTVFMTPSENKDFREALQGTLQGIGAELTLRDGLVVVVAPLKGSPAAKAGLLPEDIITEVDGNDVDGESLNQVVRRIRGKEGTEVKLKIVRPGEREPRTFTIVREEITIPSVESEIKKTQSGSVGYIALNQFGDGSIEEIRNAVKEFKDEPLKGIVIDLRFNGGGYLEGAVELTSLFLTQGEVVSVERREGEPERHYVYGRPLLPDVPLAVIINQGSASASEIVAGALQDHGRAKIIGMKSFGKGTVQEVIDLPGGSSLRVTVAHWLTPKGRNLAKEGIEPDIKVDRSTEDYEAERDPQLEAAIEWITDKEDLSKDRLKVVEESE
ncbi:MAG: S41 family peptidase [Candidatus Peregrinibacteria bacterium]|nr:S41 family peptidase [Candidatus Peregrinibacteria bacterium]